MSILDEILISGYEALREYLSFHVLTCLLPAFFIAGAISAFFRKEVLLKYFGRKYVSYIFSASAGTVLAVCSCTVIPLFAGLYRAGAKIGPLFTFLYSAPAINILAIVYTARVIGLDIGFFRAFFAVTMSIIIGALISILFKSKGEFSYEASGKVYERKHLYLIFFLFLLLIFGKGIYSLAILALIFLFLFKKFERDETIYWIRETYILFRMIFPLILIGIFFAGVIKAFASEEIIKEFLGKENFVSYLIAGSLGALFYFATLTEVPVTESLIDLGMSKSAAVALLLAGPAVSLPNFIAISRIAGIKISLTYIFLVVLFSSFSAYIYSIFY